MRERLLAKPGQKLRAQGALLHGSEKNGPPHPTMGCIRTSDAAMKSIRDFMATDPLTTMIVSGNSQRSAHAGHARFGAAHVHP